MECGGIRSTETNPGAVMAEGEKGRSVGRKQKGRQSGKEWPRTVLAVSHHDEQGALRYLLTLRGQKCV